MEPDSILQTTILRRMVTRMQRTHDRRRSSVFVGPPGIGKSTAIQAFRAANPRNVMVTRVMKRNATGPQVLQQFLAALRSRRNTPETYSQRNAGQLETAIKQEIHYAGGNLPRDADIECFPHMTIVFDEAQRLTNAAIDALRDYNEPHYYCAGTFPIGMIFVGNNELSLQVASGGMSIIDEGMNDRLLYRDRLTYDDVERGDLEAFIRSFEIPDDDAVAAIVAAFAAPRVKRSFRHISDVIDELRDEAADGPITRATVQSVLELS